ncbi:hypothetical protein ACFPPD_20975 [Cohnella suwonensis]|uniref:DUF4380 domain-containing protein n=1 Tax=Cohnella suwonensis TaxID=696072 RepID=A0ABW0LZ70_9BACL
MIVNNIHFSQYEHEIWGPCVNLTNGVIELIAPLNFGPRIIHYSYSGEKNIYYEDPKGQYYEKGEGYESVEGRWNLYGGHRLWTSPQAPGRSSYPDNEPVSWAPIPGGIVITGPIERWNQIHKDLKIEIESSGSCVTISHRIQNHGPWPIPLSLWALSVMSGGGSAFVPQTPIDLGPVPNQSYALWGKTRMDDNRITWRERYLEIKQLEQSWMKLGCRNESGWAAYLKGNTLFTKKYPFNPSGIYPSYGSSLEVFTNESFLELESLSSIYQIQPGESKIHVEKWQLHHVENNGNIEMTLDKVRLLSTKIPLTM